MKARVINPAKRKKRVSKKVSAQKINSTSKLNKLEENFLKQILLKLYLHVTCTISINDKEKKYCEYILAKLHI